MFFGLPDYMRLTFKIICSLKHTRVLGAYRFLLLIN